MKPYVATGGKPIWNEFMTPIGLICHLYHDRPQLKTHDQYGKVPRIDQETGLQEAEWRVTLAWEKAKEAELMGIVEMAQRTKLEAWPEAASGFIIQNNQQVPFIVEPLFRDGDNPQHNTEGRDYLYGKHYMNLKAKAKGSRSKDNQNVIHYDGQPGLRGPRGGDDIIMPGDIWPGCQGRATGIMFGTEYAGKHYISVRLQNIQLYKQDDRIGGGGRPDAGKQFDSIADPSQMGTGGMFANPQNNPFAQQGQFNPFQQQAVQQPAHNPFGGAPAAQHNPFGQAANKPFGSI